MVGVVGGHESRIRGVIGSGVSDQRLGVGIGGVRGQEFRGKRETKVSVHIPRFGLGSGLRLGPGL